MINGATELCWNRPKSADERQTNLSAMRVADEHEIRIAFGEIRSASGSCDTRMCGMSRDERANRFGIPYHISSIP